MLTLQPVSLAEANAFVALHHRHHKPVRGHKYSLGCFTGGQLVGVAITGRPVSRYLDAGLTLEVNSVDPGMDTGFFYAEVEFPDKAAALAWTPPAELAPYHALCAMGAVPTKVYWRAVVPGIAPSYFSNVLYLLETNVRHRSILG